MCWPFYDCGFVVFFVMTLMMMKRIFFHTRPEKWQTTFVKKATRKSGWLADEQGEGRESRCFRLVLGRRGTKNQTTNHLTITTNIKVELKITETLWSSSTVMNDYA